VRHVAVGQGLSGLGHGLSGDIRGCDMSQWVDMRKPPGVRRLWWGWGRGVFTFTRRGQTGMSAHGRASVWLFGRQSDSHCHWQQRQWWVMHSLRALAEYAT